MWSTAILLLNLFGKRTGSSIGFWRQHDIKYKTLSKLERRNLIPSENEYTRIILVKPAPNKMWRIWSLWFSNDNTVK
jgi:hypothetical protein